MTKAHLNRIATAAYNNGAALPTVSARANPFPTCHSYQEHRVAYSQYLAGPRGGTLCGPEHHVPVLHGDTVAK